MQIIELLTPQYDVAWLPWAVQYFFLAGVATGAALLTVICCWGTPGGGLRRLLPTAILTLAVSVIAAPVSLLADLHQPARFWHFYAHFTPWSWMSLGSLLLPAFVVLSLAACISWWLGKTAWLRALSPLLAVSALSIAFYTGAEMMVIRARPLWNTAWVPVNLALTGWLAAVGVAFMLARFLPTALRPGAQGLRPLRRAGLLLALGLVVTALAWATTGVTGGNRSFDEALRLWSAFPVWRLTMAGSAIAGMLILGILLAGRGYLDRGGYTLALGFVLAAAAWAFRWALFMGVQGVPKFGAGLYLYHMPLGGDGVMGMVGVAGLCVALVALVTWALEQFPARQPAAAA